MVVVVAVCAVLCCTVLSMYTHFPVVDVDLLPLCFFSCFWRPPPPRTDTHTHTTFASYHCVRSRDKATRELPSDEAPGPVAGAKPP